MGKDKSKNKNNSQIQCLQGDNKLLVDLFALLFEWHMKDVKKREKESEKVQKNLQYKNYQV